jgi:hypothetical protein
MMVLSSRHRKENAVKRFAHQYNELITGMISCFDRILFKGYLPIGWGDAMEGFLGQQGLRIKDFAKFVQKQSRRVAEHAERLAKNSGRPYLYLNGPHRKEAIVQGLIEAEGLRQGLVCVMRAVEPCQSFKLVPGEGRPRLIAARRKCLCFYFYFLDPKLGLVHVRIQSWFPLVVQVCLNGHDILARKLDKHGIAYHKQDNVFTWIEDTRRAQRFADRLVKMNWPRILTSLARRVNPLLKDLLASMDYYWVTDQGEYATDVMFKSPAALKPLYDKLVKHASTCFSAEDVLKFLGRKLHGNYQGEVLSDYKKRWPGARVKHRAKANWIKMYDKHGRVLRIETVINQPREFKVRRQGVRQGREVIDWFPLCKGVANLFRYAEICRGANRRYLDALGAVEPPVEAMRGLRHLARSKRRNGRPHRGFNPTAEDDLRLFAAIFRGEHTLHGIRNRDVRHQLFGETTDRDLRPRQANKVSRLFRRLHVHGLMAKIPRSRRWRLTERGTLLISVFLKCHYEKYPELLAALAV